MGSGSNPLHRVKCLREDVPTRGTDIGLRLVPCPSYARLIAVAMARIELVYKRFLDKTMLRNDGNL
jgi:hypothetical protein